jgi:hypothetical protein
MDGADELLLSERSHLLTLKKLLESHLAKVQMQLQELSKARARLTAVIQERSRVTDLLCQSMMTGASSSLPTPRNRTLRPSSGQSTRTCRSQIGSPHDRAKLSSSRSSVNLASRHSKSFSAPVPISFALDSNVGGVAGGVGEGEEERGGASRQPTPPRSARSRADGESYQAGTYYTEWQLELLVL